MLPAGGAAATMALEAVQSRCPQLLMLLRLRCAGGSALQASLSLASPSAASMPGAATHLTAAGGHRALSHAGACTTSAAAEPSERRDVPKAAAGLRFAFALPHASASGPRRATTPTPSAPTASRHHAAWPAARPSCPAPLHAVVRGLATAARDGSGSSAAKPQPPSSAPSSPPSSTSSSSSTSSPSLLQLDAAAIAALAAAAMAPSPSPSSPSSASAASSPGGSGGGGGGASPSDPFSAKLASRAEAELLAVLQRQSRLGAEGGQAGAEGDGQQEEEEEEMIPVANPETGERHGPRGKEPTRFGDWEIKGRCSDF